MYKVIISIIVILSFGILFSCNKASNNTVNTETENIVNKFNILENEMLAYLYLRADNKIIIYAISIEEKTSRIIFEYDSNFPIVLFMNNYQECLAMVVRIENLAQNVPLYYINGIDGFITYPLDTNYSFRVSNDGNYISGIVDLINDRKSIYIYSIEKSEMLQIFNWDTSRHNLSIFPHDSNNFKVFDGYAEYSFNYIAAEAEIDTSTLTFNIIQEYYMSGIIEERISNDMVFQLDNHRLDHHPRLMHDLNITLPELQLDYYYVSESLQLFSEQNISSEIITILEKGEFIYIREIGNELLIDEIKSNWVKIELYEFGTFGPISTGIIGWTFGGFLVY